jgi:hypothetical protein
VKKIIRNKRRICFRFGPIRSTSLQYHPNNTFVLEGGGVYLDVYATANIVPNDYDQNNVTFVSSMHLKVVFTSTPL